jgi:glycerophosphoryl diester phosphodiesterase
VLLAGGLAAGLLAVTPVPAAEPPSSPPLVIAHRGSSAAAPEHTVAAYDRAVRERSDVLECDLQMTADEVLVCVHDTTVDRTAGGTGSGRVDAHTLAELRGMDFGSWKGSEFAGERIVTFEEQLRRYRDGPAGRFYVETKAPGEYGGRMEPALVSLLRRLDLVPEGEVDPDGAPVLVQSFDLASLDAVKQLAPSLPTAWLLPALPVDFPAGIPETVDVLAPSADVVLANPGIVDEAHAAGRPVHVWTVDDPTEMDQLLGLGVDGIFTNTPAVLRAKVGAPAEGAQPAPASRPAAAPDEDDGDAFGWVVVAVGAAVVVVGGLAWWLRRRRPG